MKLVKTKKNLTLPNGMTYSEIATIMGCSWQYVREVEQKALRKLYFALKDYKL